MKEAAPSNSLLDAYRGGQIGWDEFAVRYRDEMLGERPEVLSELVRLARAHPRERLTVMCWERLDEANQHCHRTLLVDMLNDLA
jgi:uncharacterized protein YeaO (DUF488 family)